MSAATATHHLATHSTDSGHGSGHGRGIATGSGLTFGGVLRSEWIKLRTVRSTLWCYALIVLLTIGLALLIAGVQRTAPGATPTATPVTLSAAAQQAAWIRDATLGINFSQLVIAVLGALVITGEYGTGMIRSSFAAVPSRLPVVIAKTLVFGVTTFIVSLFSLVVGALVILPVLQGHSITPNLGDGAAWLALIGGAGYLALVGVIALGIGLLVRSSAAGIAASVGLLLVVPIILRVVASVTSAVWPGNVASFLPSEAGGTLFAYPVTAPAAASGVVVLDSWASLAVLVGWAVLMLVVGCVMVKRRDA
ncbi:MAG: ABC transporter permease [Actinomycetota bacterium]|nr:ABC transporter permease [Actinomycetota bacterium]